MRRVSSVFCGALQTALQGFNLAGLGRRRHNFSGRGRKLFDLVDIGENDQCFFDQVVEEV